ncbi:unnamed protein product [Ceratitis capitata]|uniref:(Mediterranean fruit fly) hypothetical protein n=1 Tax=Ceratitis capitata TaxID=7213 RepID=A0A811V1P4_CERCA|nr:unnamed protein product [Ceratitis capitata]
MRKVQGGRGPYEGMSCGCGGGGGGGHSIEDFVQQRMTWSAKDNNKPAKPSQGILIRRQQKV